MSTPPTSGMRKFNPGDFVMSPFGPGKVLFLTRYMIDEQSNSTYPADAVVIYPTGEGSTFDVDQLTRISKDEYKEHWQTDDREDGARVLKVKQVFPSVWRWCSVCWERTDHLPTILGEMLRCTVCGTRIPKTASDPSEQYKIQVEDASETLVVNDIDQL